MKNSYNVNIQDSSASYTLRRLREALTHHKRNTCALVSVLPLILDDLNALKQWAQSNKGKRIGPKAVEEMRNLFYHRDHKLINGVQSYVVYFSYNRPYNFMDAPEFKIEVEFCFPADVGVSYLSHMLVCVDPKERPYENVVNDSFIAAIEDMIVRVARQLEALRKTKAKYASAERKLLAKAEKAIAALGELEESMEPFQTGNLYMATVPSPMALVEFRK